MRKSIGHYLLIAAVAMAFLSVGTGCKTGGWSMPGASWVSWGKKKPPTSSIAGTREPTQPPSITVPPYPPEDSSSESNTALAGYPSTGASGAGATSSGSTMPGGTTNSTSPTAEPAGYAVGPYPTTTPPTAKQTQQGFYQQTTPPETATADARNAAGSTYQPTYGAEQPNSTYSAPTGYGTNAGPTGYGAEPAPTGYGNATTPYPAPNGYAAPPTPPSYAGVPSGTADAAYPANPTGTSGPYPAPTAAGAYPYPESPYAGTYPATDQYGSTPTTAPNTYGQPAGGAYPPTAPTGYGTATPVYSASSQNSAYGAPTGSSNTYESTNQYRPGSTGRNANLLSPSGSTRMASPTGGTTYPNTYYNR